MSPEIDGGAFPIKRTIGESVEVQADIFTDGHDAISAILLHRRVGEPDWTETPMRPLVNDRWEASFPVDSRDPYEYTVRAWIDRFASWRRDLRKKIDAEQEVLTDLQVGAGIIETAAKRAAGDDRETLEEMAGRLRKTTASEEIESVAFDHGLATLMHQHQDRSLATDHPVAARVEVDRERARFSAWYEMFPRSCTDDPSRHGTFKDCEKRLPYIAEMGFDVLYLPPIHPIGRTHRKGRNNARVAEPGDVGSPWAIGAKEGGHKAVHPDLGTLEDFKSFRKAAERHGIEIALDVAFQCAPDHPYVKEHPEWFRHRPDGSIQYAENPPKKYEDIYPFDFECEDWRGLWEELKSVFLFWIEQGVKIFRVDNPHTKPIPFWEWVIREVRAVEPDAIFLAEAFTRPKIMKRLAKIGFTQSYTYFAWRNSKWELAEYFTELTQTQMAEYFRPNPWPNTPDILNAYLQFGGRPAFIARAVLAGTLAASYGVYGPAFELCEGRPREPDSEEYLDSEKYQIRAWDLDDPESIREVLTIVNRARRDNAALQTNRLLRFHNTDNDALLCYSKRTGDRSNVILCIVNVDPHHTQSGFVDLDLAELGVEQDDAFQVYDLLGGSRFIWRGARNYVELNPHAMPAHLFVLKRKTLTERNFDYFL